MKKYNSVSQAYFNWGLWNNYEYLMSEVYQTVSNTYDKLGEYALKRVDIEDFTIEV